MDLGSVREAALDTAPLSQGARRTNTPHEFYRYPARFSAQFAAAVIEAFTARNEVVLDPFVGGGTTVVEAIRLGRQAIACDLNALATFVTRVKSTPLNDEAVRSVERWVQSCGERLNIHAPAPEYAEWRQEGYFKDLEAAPTWRIRKLIAQALQVLPRDQLARDFSRCVVLRTAQWALDMRAQLPTVAGFRRALLDNALGMLDAHRAFFQDHSPDPPRIIDVGLPGLGKHLDDLETPRLVLTSPPYPGVYVNYHRWKLFGRREIPAPYWIANRRDGNGLDYYTMCARNEHAGRRTLNKYFDRLRTAYEDLATLVGPETVMVQLVGFNDPTDQLARYLEVMRDVGLDEVRLDALATEDDGRLWRTVPGRRWWARAGQREEVAAHTAREVVLIHRVARDPSAGHEG